jgi:hypothetical protein
MIEAAAGPTLSQQLYLNSILIVFVSLFFYIWALCNTLTEHYFDIGLVCFPFTFATGLYSLYLLSSISLQQSHHTNSTHGTLTSPLTPTSPAHLFSTNLTRLTIFSYVITIIAYISSVSRTPISAITYFIYCLVAILAWGIHGIYFHRTIVSFADEISSDRDEGGEFNEVTATRNSLHRKL